MARTETMVRVYRGSNDYSRDAQKLAKRGWTPINTVERRPRAGCARIVLLWWLTLLRPPKPELVVTYQRTAGDIPLTQSASARCPQCGNPVSASAYFCPSCNANLRR